MDQHPSVRNSSDHKEITEKFNKILIDAFNNLKKRLEADPIPEEAGSQELATQAGKMAIERAVKHFKSQFEALHEDSKVLIDRSPNWVSETFATMVCTELFVTFHGTADLMAETMDQMEEYVREQRIIDAARPKVVHDADEANCATDPAECKCLESVSESETTESVSETTESVSESETTESVSTPID